MIEPDDLHAGLADLPERGVLALPSPLDLAIWTRSAPLLPDKKHFERRYGSAPALSRNTLEKVQLSMLASSDQTLPLRASSLRKLIEFLEIHIPVERQQSFVDRLVDPARRPSSRLTCALLGYLWGLDDSIERQPSYVLDTANALIDEDAALAVGVSREELVHAPRLLLASDTIAEAHGEHARLADTMLYLHAAWQAVIGSSLADHDINGTIFDGLLATPYERGVLQARYFALLASLGGDDSWRPCAPAPEEDPARYESLHRQWNAWRANDSDHNLSRDNLDRMVKEWRGDDHATSFWAVVLWQQYDALLSVRTMIETQHLCDATVTVLFERFALHLIHHRAALALSASRTAQLG